MMTTVRTAVFEISSISIAHTCPACPPHTLATTLRHRAVPARERPLRRIRRSDCHHDRCCCQSEPPAAPPDGHQRPHMHHPGQTRRAGPVAQPGDGHASRCQPAPRRAGAYCPIAAYPTRRHRAMMPRSRPAPPRARRPPDHTARRRARRTTPARQYRAAGSQSLPPPWLSPSSLPTPAAVVGCPGVPAPRRASVPILPAPPSAAPPPADRKQTVTPEHTPPFPPTPPNPSLHGSLSSLSQPSSYFRLSPPLGQPPPAGHGPAGACRPARGADAAPSPGAASPRRCGPGPPWRADRRDRYCAARASRHRGRDLSGRSAARILGSRPAAGRASVPPRRLPAPTARPAPPRHSHAASASRQPGAAATGSPVRCRCAAGQAAHRRHVPVTRHAHRSAGCPADSPPASQAGDHTCPAGNAPPSAGPPSRPLSVCTPAR